MQPLSSWAHQEHRRDRGAIAVLVAIVMVPVLLSVAALAIDVGSVYLGRQNAQNGADAAALALADACATGQPSCTTDVTGSGLNALVQDNVSPGTGKLSAPPCIQKDGTLCQASNLSRLPECPYPLPSTLKGVQVRTEADIKLAFPSIWGHSQEQPAACASAAWGPVGSHTAAVPITLSDCGWQKQGGDPQAEPTGSGYGYGGAGQPAWPANSKELTVVTTGKTNESCLVDGRTSNGGFSWLSNNACAPNVTNGGWVNGDPGNNIACPDIKNYVGKNVILPIFDCVVVSGSVPTTPPSSWPSCSITDFSGGGSNVYYHIMGWASFYLSGYSFGGGTNTKASILTGNTSCGGSGSSQNCLFGWFTKATISDGTIDPNAPDLGVSAIQMAG